MYYLLQKISQATVLKAMNDTEDVVEAPKVRPPKTEAQLETIKKARAKKAEHDDARIQERERLKAEARFEKLLDLFEKVRIEPPPEVPKKKRPVKPATEEDGPVQKPKPRAVVEAKPQTREVFLRFM